MIARTETVSAFQFGEERLSRPPSWSDVIVLKSVPVYKWDNLKPESIAVLSDRSIDIKLWREMWDHHLWITKICGPCPNEDRY